MENKNIQTINLEVNSNKDELDLKYTEAISEIQSRYIPEKWDRVLNHNWQKEWGPYIKYDHDWDWYYLFDLIMYKLEKMRVYLATYSHATSEWTERINNELTEVLSLGRKLKTYDYDKEYCDFRDAHTTPYVKVLKKKEVAENAAFADKLEALNGEELVKLNIPREEDLGLNLYGKRLTTAKKWCKNHHYRLKDVTFAYGSDWDSEENYAEYLKLIEKCEKEEQDDYDKFFLLISKNMRGWWD